MEAIEYVYQNNTHLLFLHPIATHLIQPLDELAFVQFKANLRQAYHEHRQTYCGARTKLKSLVVHLAYETEYRSFTGEILVTFRKRTGLHDPNSVMAVKRVER